MAERLEKGVDYPGVTIVYFCHDGNGKFIMAKRSHNTRDEHGRWDIRAGALEFGDTPEQTLRKEISEEYCTEVVSFEFLGFRDVQREHQGKKTHWLALDFKMRVDPSKVKNGEPHKFEAIGWFSLDDRPADEEVHSQFPHFLELYTSKLR
ncbi:NUDIX domain-containing protein [Candidatus Microgenomates bacterium]|nr:NUDIX domain-containing protein [Candidatus Microgenomates bacterium]